MENDDLMSKQHNFVNHFENAFRRLLSGEELDLYEEGISSGFEAIAANLLAEVPERKYMWYDGVADLTASIRKRQQVEFNGEMWVADDKTQWKEDFRATITDKKSTKQGIWIIIWIGSDRGEGDLSTAFNLSQ